MNLINARFCPHQHVSFKCAESSFGPLIMSFYSKAEGLETLIACPGLSLGAVQRDAWQLTGMVGVAVDQNGLLMLFPILAQMSLSLLGLFTPGVSIPSKTCSGFSVDTSGLGGVVWNWFSDHSFVLVARVILMRASLASRRTQSPVSEKWLLNRSHIHNDAVPEVKEGFQ